MSIKAKMPLIISVTGHRLIREQDRDSIESSIRKILEKLKNDYPDTELKLMTNLAEGADALCAEIALELGIAHIAALPQPLDVYRTVFEGEALSRFDYLIDRSESVFCAPDTEKRPSDASHRFDYRQGGLYLVHHSQLLIALWEGNDPKPGGCGAAEIVEAAKMEKLPVIHVCTPRSDMCSGSAGEIQELGSMDSIKKLDDFNRRVQELPEYEQNGICPQAYYAAAALSRKSAKTYRSILRWMSVLGTALAVSLLLFDELELGKMIYVCGALLIVLIAIRRFAFACRCHDNYMEYRVLAECLRVMSFLRYSGSRVSISALFTYYQKTSVGWVTRSVSALETLLPSGETHDISKVWLEEQLNYHIRKEEKTSRQSRRNGALLKTVCGLSILVYLGAVLMEMLNSSDWLRIIVGITLGIFAAFSLFLSLYYGRLSVSRHNEDSTMMADFYRTALEKLKEDGQTDALLEQCAREELLENANWYAYTSENAPDLSFL